MSERPNIILIQTDQQSWSTLSLYGNPVLDTPAIEGLADRGVVFERAYCNYPACAPSRSSMMTGRYASTIRNHANHMLIDPREQTLPSTLKRGGYQTALVGKNHAFFDAQADYYRSQSDPVREPGDSELHRAFDFVFQGGHVAVDDADSDPDLAAAIEHARQKSWGQQHSWSVNPYPAEKSVTHRLTTEAIRYVTDVRDPDEPFFLWFSIPDPHTPYQVSEPYASMYDPDSIPSPIADSLDGKPERQKVAHYLDHNHLHDDAHFRQLRAIHYGMIRQIDDNLARLFAALAKQGLTDNTMIVFLSDHGDAIGDHGIIQKHNFFYDSFTRVPFIVSWPGRVAPQRTAPARTTELVELVDVMPTLLDAAGVDAPHGLQGESLMPFLTGATSTTKDAVFIESGEAGDPPKLSDVVDAAGNVVDRGTSFAWCAFRDAWIGRGRAIRTAKWKLCLYANGDGELYDMVKDPDEVTNRFADPTAATIRAQLTERLALWQMGKDDTIPENPTVKLSL
ncbi:MAG: DUF4976 domain-containing protein [Spirochaetaceae bacterium]|nr:MAG: DUF4976 domain-containing protein [Spirochaetaceae bacterium]